MNITVVGAGVFGSWCAWFLAERGHHVALVEQYGPANARASSADHSRVIRCGYGGDAIYSRWARASLDDWRMLAARSGRALVVDSGALFLGAAGNHYVRDTAQTLAALGIPAETIEPAALPARFPQIDGDGLGPTLYEPGAGVIRARDAVQALVDGMAADGRVQYRSGRVVPLDESSAAADVRLASGDSVASDAFVFACGPWLPALFPRAIGPRIRPTRQEVLHFGVPPGDDQFALARLPVWIDFSAGLYGIPDLDGRGFKVGVDRHGPAIDPETHDRVLRADILARTRMWLRHRFPGLGKAPLLDSHVCQYENTHTGDFLIDRHPVRSNVWIVGGGSGHGFKHGPAIGRYLAELITDARTPEERFTLKAKGTAAARAVY